MAEVAFLRRRTAGVGFNIDHDPANDELTLLGLDVGANGIDLGGVGKVFDMAPGTNPGDAVTLAQLQQAVINGGTVKELLLCQDQLNNTLGIRAAAAMYFTAQPVSTDNVVIDNGTIARTYQFGTGGDVTVTIGATAADSMANLAAAITADGTGVWDGAFTASGLAEINASGVIVVMERTVPAGDSTSRIYGTWATQANAQVVEYASGGVVDLDYQSNVNATLPSADPAEGRFGLRRQQSALLDGEIHNMRKDNSLYSWDDTGDMWNVLSGASSVPDATEGSGGGLKGKITADSDQGLDITAGVLSIVLESDGAIVFDATNFGLEINLEAVDPSLQIVSNELGVKFGALSGLEKTASGLQVKVDGTTIQRNAATGELEAIGVGKESYTVAAPGVTIGDPVYFSANDTVKLGQANNAADIGFTAERVFGIACATVAAAGTVEVIGDGPAVGVISGATAGDPYWLAASGGLTATAPVGNTTRLLVGHAINATDLWVDIDHKGSGR